MMPWEEYQQQSSAPVSPQLKPWEEYAALKKPDEKGFISRVGEDWNKRIQDQRATTQRTKAGEQGQLSDSWQGATNLLGAAGDIGGEAIVSAAKTGFNALPNNWQQGLTDAGRYIAQSPVGQYTGQAMQMGSNAWKGLEESHPVAARNIRGGFDLATGIPAIGGEKAALEGAIDLTKQGGKIASREGAELIDSLKKADIPSAESVKNISRASYKEADELGGMLKPENSEKFVNGLESLKKQTKWGAATNGDDAIASLVERYKPLKNEPITLQAAQEIDEGLSELVDGFYDNRGKINKEGLKVQKAQQAFRDMIENTPESEIVGGKEGFNAWKRGQQEWSAALRLGDMERIITRAEAMDNPATSLKAGFRMLERTGMHGYIEEEKAAISKAARSGIIGGALRTVLGSRLIGSMAGIAAGSSRGPVGAVMGGLAGSAQSAASRGLANTIQMSRVNEARRAVAKRLPSEIGKLPPREALKELKQRK